MYEAVSLVWSEGFCGIRHRSFEDYVTFVMEKTGWKEEYVYNGMLLPEKYEGKDWLALGTTIYVADEIFVPYYLISDAIDIVNEDILSREN